MKVTLHAIRSNPNHIEEIQIDDVASFTVDDSNILLKFNKGGGEIIPLRANDGENIHEWSGLSFFCTRIGMKVDMKL